MKVILAAFALTGLSWSVALAEPTAGTFDNQSTPQLVVPEILSSPSIGATLVTSQSAYSYGSPVHLIFTIDNHTKNTVNYQFESSQLYDIVISDSSGTSVWNWSRNKVFSPLVKHLVISAGRSKVFRIFWQQRNNDDHPVPPGTYNVTATLIPMESPKISGNLLSNLSNDPVNTGVPMEDGVGTGAVAIKNTTPPVYAKTKFVILPQNK